MSIIIRALILSVVISIMLAFINTVRKKNKSKSFGIILYDLFSKYFGIQFIFILTAVIIYIPWTYITIRFINIKHPPFWYMQVSLFIVIMGAHYIAVKVANHLELMNELYYRLNRYFRVSFIISLIVTLLYGNILMRTINLFLFMGIIVVAGIIIMSVAHYLAKSYYKKIKRNSIL